MPIQKIKSGRILSPEINNFIGNKGQLFFDEDTGQLRLSDGITPGGIDILGGGSGGPVAWTSITGKPNFTTVSTSGSYTDLINTPTIPADISDLTDTGNLLGGGSTGDFIFAAGDVSLPLNYSTMTLSTYQNGGNKESRLTLSTSGISSLDVGNNFRIRNGYGTGFEHEWLFNANGSLALPGSGDILRNGVSVLGNSGTSDRITTGTYSVSIDANGNLSLPYGAVGASQIISPGSLWLNSNGYLFQLSSNGSIDIPLVNNGTTSLIRTSGNTTINSSGKEWIFKTDGNLTLPDGGDILENGVSVLFDGTYSPANAGDWSSPAPTTIEEALDRLATLVKTLNSGTGA